MKTLVFTGGHHTSALVVAKELKKKGWKIIWYGHRHSMWGDKSDSAEYREVTAAGIKFYDLKAGKFYATFSPLKLIRIPYGFLQAFLLLFFHKPNGIISFGGYLAVPTVIAGWLLGIPAIAHEQTVVSGWANKFIGLFVRKIAVSWSNSLLHYPKNKAIFTGLPLRPEILKIKRPSNRLTNNQLTIYITGGKQGSHEINEVIFAALPQLLKKYRVIHQTGSSTVYNDYQRALQLIKPGYEVFNFDSPRAILALKEADIVISRAGAHIIYELGYLGMRCVLIPIPWVSHDEQTANAKVLQAAGLAVILSQAQLSPETLLESTNKALLLNPKPLNLTDGTQKLIQLVYNTLENGQRKT